MRGTECGQKVGAFRGLFGLRGGSGPLPRSGGIPVEGDPAGLLREGGLCLRGGSDILQQNGSIPAQEHSLNTFKRAIAAGPSTNAASHPTLGAFQGRPRDRQRFSKPSPVKGTRLARLSSNEEMLRVYLGKEVHVQCMGAREFRGTVRGLDGFGSMVLDNSTEYIMVEDPEDPEVAVWSGRTRKMGLMVLLGKAILTILPTEGLRQIPNPFADKEPEGGLPLEHPVTGPLGAVGAGAQHATGQPASRWAG